MLSSPNHRHQLADTVRHAPDTFKRACAVCNTTRGSSVGNAYDALRRAAVACQGHAVCDSIDWLVELFDLDTAYCSRRHRVSESQLICREPGFTESWPGPPPWVVCHCIELGFLLIHNATLRCSWRIECSDQSPFGEVSPTPVHVLAVAPPAVTLTCCPA